ncbi:MULTISPECIES: hypothetical protein [Caproicibacterium]|uniref:Uncharacterized protein n=1 Tax=Caproicibacterium argilliputei TaxID=3030016 RepID=A0AA97DAW8_9FIRM|nr:hypothetical protein [Caproicibacterium argilliputei]WOC32061.1 hypothetical protein PXC00_12825 [Caproicibacterium argilliputei]
MKYVGITLIAVVLLLLQNALCKKRSAAFLFLLPVLSIAGGLVYQAVTLHAVQLAGLTPFLLAAGCLLLFGAIRRAEHRTAEMEHMKSQDL